MPEQKCTEWGGNWNASTESCEVSEQTPSEVYRNRTVVRSVADAREAFEKYTDWHRFVVDACEPSSETAVLLPCGAQKPIGTSSIHTKKVDAIKQSPLAESDIIVVSEPCTVVPHWLRLALAPVNYDFPPEYTEAETAPTVFDVFSTRVAEWLAAWDYDSVYAYLPQGHWNVVEQAYQTTTWDGELVRVPNASYNPETGSYSGDLFKSMVDVSTKLRAVEELVETDRVTPPDGADDLVVDACRFYEERYNRDALVH